jgi:hypothetical protein
MMEATIGQEFPDERAYDRPYALAQSDVWATLQPVRGSDHTDGLLIHRRIITVRGALEDVEEVLIRLGRLALFRASTVSGVGSSLWRAGS